MMNILIWIFAICVLTFTITIVGENIADNLPPENRFRKWWRNNVIGDDNYGDDF